MVDALSLGFPKPEPVAESPVVPPSPGSKKKSKKKKKKKKQSTSHSDVSLRNSPAVHQKGEGTAAGTDADSESGDDDVDDETVTFPSTEQQLQ